MQARGGDVSLCANVHLGNFTPKVNKGERTLAHVTTKMKSILPTGGSRGQTAQQRAQRQVPGEEEAGMQREEKGKCKGKRRTHTALRARPRSATGICTLMSICTRNEPGCYWLSLPLPRTETGAWRRSEMCGGGRYLPAVAAESFPPRPLRRPRCAACASEFLPPVPKIKKRTAHLPDAPAGEAAPQKCIRRCHAAPDHGLPLFPDVQRRPGRN